MTRIVFASCVLVLASVQVAIAQSEQDDERIVVTVSEDLTQTLFLTMTMELRNGTIFSIRFIEEWALGDFWPVEMCFAKPDEEPICLREDVSSPVLVKGSYITWGDPDMIVTLTDGMCDSTVSFDGRSISYEPYIVAEMMELSSGQNFHTCKPRDAQNRSVTP